MPVLPLFDETFLRAQWDAEFTAFQESAESAALLQRLKAWAAREQLNERASETAFIQRFFVETWGYSLQGHDAGNSAYTCRPQFEVSGAGQGGGIGFADLALGNFGTDAIPQVLCEFKDIRSGLDARLNSPQTVPLKPALNPDWLWSEIGTAASWKKSPDASAGLASRELTAWAKAQHADALQARHDTLDALLQPGVTIAIENTEDELILTIGGREALRLYDRPDTPFIAAQWGNSLRDTNVTEAFDAKRLIKILLDLRTTTDAPLRDRILTLDQEITALDATLATKESALNTLIYRLYRLTPEEIKTVEAG